MIDRAMWIADLLCGTACAILMIMTSLAIPEGGRHMYEINTGLFCALFCLLPALFYHLHIMRLPLWVVALIEFAIFMHAYGVLLLQYDLLIYYDTVTHTLSSMVITVCIYLTLMCVHHYCADTRFSMTWTLLLVFVIMMTFGGIWEAFEYVVDNLSGTMMQYSPFDTVRDMLANATGSVLGSTIAYIFQRHHDFDDTVESFQLHPRLIRVLKGRQ